ncbi:peptidoglycan/LPS O-acetylase OafA/YrhL [Sphingomonas sp. SORGH_AS870]|uniref:acyltransferase family protein n=1 Tax=Sphingomonas sp. SORGH_AS_0870 TaxID=3041801 RepID=UPI00285D8C1E|nr:acyltransferase [Sphingomonas sp. SORGH_AS_0870]MDR6146738.1 peptidoglycan/LPS O-acetylase OafA/YrhL [Sphingomonas sp. SORGH_AS_0870]
MTSQAPDILPHAPNHAQRFAFLDVARGLAALVVMLQHSLEGSGIESLEPGAVATTWLNLGETGVAIFFLVSGFIIPASVREGSTVRDFVIRRTMRIYPLYWAIFAVTIVILVGFGGQSMPPLGTTIGSHMLFVQEWLHLPNFVGGSWTLFIEMIWYIAFALAFFSFFGVGFRLVASFLVAYALITFSAAYIFPSFPFGRLSIFALCFYGYLYLLYFEERVSKHAFHIGSTIFLILIAINIFVGFYLNPSTAHAAPSFSCVAISWSIALLVFPLLLYKRHSAFAQSPALRYLGEISYSVYLLHSAIMRALELTDIRGLPFIALTFTLTILGATLTYKYIEKPGVMLARSWTRSRTPSLKAATH